MARKTSHALGPIIAIIVGILIIAYPPILAWAIGLYLIITGILDLVNKAT